MIQAEQFIEFYKRQNPVKDVETSFSFWGESKDFHKDDSTRIWEKVLDGIKQ